MKQEIEGIDEEIVESLARQYNGDTHKFDCSSIDMDTYGIDLFGTKTDLTNIKYEDISLMAIFVEDETQNEKLTFRLVREPKVERK